MTKYAVEVLNTETNKYERGYVGTWNDCIRHARDLIVMGHPYSSNANGMPDGLYVQGNEIEPGHVGYNHPGSFPGSRLWIVVSDANPPPPVEHEPFDYNAAILESAELMKAELIKPENLDILEAVNAVGNHDGDNGHFMFDGFKLGTDEQTTRWNAIVDAGDKHGHSGASYAFACRQLQCLLEEHLAQ